MLTNYFTHMFQDSSQKCGEFQKLHLSFLLIQHWYQHTVQGVLSKLQKFFQSHKYADETYSRYNLKQISQYFLCQPHYAWSFQLYGIHSNFVYNTIKVKFLFYRQASLRLLGLQLCQGYKLTLLVLHTTKKVVPYLMMA